MHLRSPEFSSETTSEDDLCRLFISNASVMPSSFDRLTDMRCSPWTSEALRYLFPSGSIGITPDSQSTSAEFSKVTYFFKRLLLVVISDPFLEVSSLSFRLDRGASSTSVSRL